MAYLFGWPVLEDIAPPAHEHLGRHDMHTLSDNTPCCEDINLQPAFGNALQSAPPTSALQAKQHRPVKDGTCLAESVACRWTSIAIFPSNGRLRIAIRRCPQLLRQANAQRTIPHLMQPHHNCKKQNFRVHNFKKRNAPLRNSQPRPVIMCCASRGSISMFNAPRLCCFALNSYRCSAVLMVCALPARISRPRHSPSTVCAAPSSDRRVGTWAF